MLDDAARHAHAEQAAGPAVLELLRRLRNALRAGSHEVILPVGLARDAVLRQSAAAVRAEVLHRIDAAVARGELKSDGARLLVERFALDGALRRADEVAARQRVGRETMRLRYIHSAEVLADGLAAMPLTLRPEVQLDASERELQAACALEAHRPRGEAPLQEYVEQRVRWRIFDDPAPSSPGRGRVEDRRWQRLADQVAAAVETGIALNEPPSLLPPADTAVLTALRKWLQAGGQVVPEEMKQDPVLGEAFLRVAVHGQADALQPHLRSAMPGSQGYDAFDLADLLSASWDGQGLGTQLSALATARAQPSESPLVRATVHLLAQALAEDLAEASFPLAGEHVLRAAAEPTGGSLVDDDYLDVTRFVEQFALKRFITRSYLHLARGPQALPQLRATLLSAAAFSSRRPDGIPCAEAMRLKLLLIDSELAAQLVGSPAETAREHYEAVIAQLSYGPRDFELQGLDELLQAGTDLLGRIWRGENATDRAEVERFVRQRLQSGAPGRAVTTRRWLRPA